MDREFVRVGYYVRDAFLVELQRLGWRGVFLAAMLRLPGVRYFTGDQVGVLMTLRRKAAVREGYMGTLR